jgi:predicted RecA/RadA family phage recombinase
MAVGVLLKTGTTIPYTPVAAVSAGDLIDCGTFAAVAIRDIPAGTLGELDAWDSPTYRITKNAGEAIIFGALVYLNTTGLNNATGTVGSSAGTLGVCVAVNPAGALAGDATVDVKLTSP